MAGANQSGDAQAMQVAEYKQILRDVLETRPSGTRQRLANALGKNRSFVSQIANPQYSTPIPARHVEVIFEICHFAKDAREQFLAAYQLAHPVRLAAAGEEAPLRRHSILLPDLGDAERNAKLDQLLADFVHKLVRLVDE